MATNESESAEVGAQSPSMNDIAVKAIRQGIAEQASRQEEFQLSVRVQGSPDETATKEFHQDLIEFIKRKVEAGEVSIPEVAIALWDELNRMEEMVREASEEMDDDTANDDASDDQNEASDDGDDTPIADMAGQPSTDDGEDGDTEDADAEADSGLPEDPAFH
jgi:hypothetical protein